MLGGYEGADKRISLPITVTDTPERVCENLSPVGPEGVNMNDSAVSGFRGTVRRPRIHDRNHDG
jgi:hypothetical protein